MSETEMLETTEAKAPSVGTWKADTAHSNVNFTARYMMLSKVRGGFGRFDATIQVGETPEASSVAATIEAASIDTNNEMRDGHLKSPDFLDVERFPTLSFRSTKVERVGKRELRVSGDLTIRDVSRPVTLEVEFEGAGPDVRGNDRVAFSARTEIDREEFGITWNQALETGGVLVGRKIPIELDIQAIRRTAEQPA